MCCEALADFVALGLEDCTSYAGGVAVVPLHAELRHFPGVPQRFGACDIRFHDLSPENSKASSNLSALALGEKLGQRALLPSVNTASSLHAFLSNSLSEPMLCEMACRANAMVLRKWRRATWCVRATGGWRESLLELHITGASALRTRKGQPHRRGAVMHYTYAPSTRAVRNHYSLVLLYILRGHRTLPQDRRCFAKRLRLRVAMSFNEGWPLCVV